MNTAKPQATTWAWPEAGWITRAEMLQIPALERSDAIRLAANPSVSVLMMTRNHEAYLEQAVASVLEQDLQEPFEILIGEDHSTDDTLNLAFSLQGRHPERIRMLHADRNVGITANFLRLVARARAPFLALLEGDDAWSDPGKLRLQLELLRTTPSAVLAGAATANRITWLPAKPAYGLVDLLRRYAVHTSTYLIRAEHLQCYPRFPDIIGWETMLLGYLLARGDCAYLNRVVSYYRRHDGGLWHNADRHDRLVRSQQCIDALQSYFFGRFQQELLSRELWIYRLDLALPPTGRRAHWLQSWGVLIGLTPRLWLRAPLSLLWMFLGTAAQPLSAGWFKLRRRAALGTRLRKRLRRAGQR